jgi:integrase
MAIYPDKKGKQLTGRFRVEVQLDGRRMRGRFDTIDEARQREVEWKGKLAAGDTEDATVRDDLRGAPKTLSQLLAKASPLVWNGSDHGEVCGLRVRKIIGWLGDTRLSDLSTSYLDDLVLRLRAEGRSPATINRYLSALHVILDWGHARGRAYIPVMPDFSWQDEDEGRIRYLTQDEEQLLSFTLRSLGQDEMADYCIVAIDTGCRRSELLTAKRDQLDGMWLRLWATKNGKPRSVPLTERAQVVLESRLPWKFTDAQLTYWWAKAKEAMGLAEDDQFVVHALRHTCATRLVERGVNLRVIQRFMGHLTIETTLRYAHVSDELLADAATRLSQVVSIHQGRPEGDETEGHGGGSDPTPRPGCIRRATGEQLGESYLPTQTPDLVVYGPFPSNSGGRQ